MKADVLKMAMKKLREESVEQLEISAHIGIDIASNAGNSEVGILDHKTGKIKPAQGDEAREASLALAKVTAMGVSVVTQELQRRLCKDKDNAELKSALEGINKHLHAHNMRRAFTELVDLLAKHDEPKRAGDNKKPSEFRVDLDRLKPGNN